MNNTSTSDQPEHGLHLSIVGFLIVLLLPLLSIPRPTMVTGHPWEVELIVAGIVGSAFIWLFAKYDLRSLGPLIASRKQAFALVFICIFTVWSGVSGFWADATLSVVHHTALWFMYGAILLFSLLYLNKQRSIRFTVIAFGTASVIILAICLFDFATGEFKFIEGTLRIRYAKYGEMLAMIGPFLIAASFYTRHRVTRAASMVAAGSAWLAVMFSLSRGAFLAGAIGFLILFAGIFVYSGRKARKTVLVTALMWLGMTVGVQLLFTFYSAVPATTEYVIGKSDHNRKSSQFRKFTWKIGTSMAISNPVIGVGADNFGTSFNKARREYFANGAGKEGNVSVAEDHMVERAHNEVLQIFAELGVVGLLLFGAFLLTFIAPFFILLTKSKRLSPLLIGAAAAMSTFAVSSMFSSFAFRAMQNGIVFILIFAIGLYELSKGRKNQRDITILHFSSNPVSYAKWLLPATTFLFAAFHALTGISNFYTMYGEFEEDHFKSRAHFDKALKLNPENGSAYYVGGIREFIEKRPDEALPLLEKSKRFGATATQNYYYTAASHLLNDDFEKAGEVLSQAVAIYPKSVYAHVHYSVVLAKAGRAADSKTHYSEALRLNVRQAETWKLILEDSLLNATDAVKNREDLDKPHELKPQNIVKSIYHLSRINKARE